MPNIWNSGSANALTFIPPKSKALISFKQMSLPDSDNFLLYTFFQAHFILYTNLINYTTSKIFIKNNADYFIQITRHHKLCCMIEPLYKSCFAVSVSHEVALSLFISLPLYHKLRNITIPLNKSSLKIELLNGIKIYSNKDIIE